MLTDVAAAAAADVAAAAAMVMNISATTPSAHQFASRPAVRLVGMRRSVRRARPTDHRFR